jgi:small conductance mechanosensitive channel
MEGFIGRGEELIASFGYKVIAALLIFLIGRWAAKAARNVTRKMMGRGDMDPTLVSFVESLVYFAMLAFVVLAALAQLGIQTTSFIAVLGAAGLAVGLALQGSLANFASGVLLLVFRPFRVGDYIEGAGVAGVVEEIRIFTTMLSTLDNKAIIIPNSKLTGDNITNYTKKDRRRVDLVFGVAVGNDIDAVKRAVLGVLEADARVLKDPAPTVAVQGIAGGVMEVAVRPWVKTEDYWDVYFGTNENVKKRFDADGIRGPVPQREVRLHRD